MISDFVPQTPRRRPGQKRIEPIAKPQTKPLHEQAREYDPLFDVPQHATPEEPSPLLPMVVDHQPAAPKRPKKRWGFSWRPNFTRKQQIIGGALAVLLVVGSGTAWMITHKNQPVATKAPKKQVAKPAPTPPPPVYSTLTGLQVADESVNQRPVTGVMIENSMSARPQSGLSEAGVVFEAIAEGGITRFLALFQDSAPGSIGPVRSARPYYVQWALGFDAAYAHVGGSPQALANIKTWGVKDMNQFAYGGYFHRTTDRAARHNVYTSIAKLNELEASRGFTSTYTGFPRGKEAPAATPTATSIDFKISSFTYDPHYDYVAATNSYNRTEAGEAHMDANTGKQISPKVVIGMVVPLGRGEPNGGGYYSDYTVIGSGQAYIFQNGTVTIGTWAKTANNTQITFTDANGAAIPLIPGQTWISAIANTSQAIYK